MKYVWPLALVLLSYAFGWFSHGWYANSQELKNVNKEITQAKEVQAKSDAGESQASQIKVVTETKYKTITRDVIRYVQTPDRTVCSHDAEFMRIKSEAVNAANSITAVDAGAVQGLRTKIE